MDRAAATSRGCLALAMLAAVGCLAAPRAPNIVFMLADDLGWNDVSFHGSQQIPTPHIDDLAASGVTMDKYYVNAVCSPTRASLLSSRAMIHHGVFQPYGYGNDAEGLNLSYTLLPEHLKNEYGYRTYMLGKWHLGMKTEQYQPTARGFDRYFGYYDGYTDYWMHRSNRKARDLHVGDNDAGIRPERVPDNFADLNGMYSTFMYSDKAAEWIGEHATEHAAEPFFMYVAFQAMHSAGQIYVQAPDQYLEKFASVDPDGGKPCGQYDPKCTAGAKRRSVAAMVSAMDDAIGQIVAALKSKGLFENTIIVWSSDNGGPVASNGNMANNFPLRGGKGGYFEGGIRAAGLVTGPGTGPARISSEMFHVSDWGPSLLTAVKRAVTGNPYASHTMRTKQNEVPFKKGDGIDNWDSIARGKTRRTQIIHAAQADGSVLPHFAIRSGNYKLMWPGDSTHPGWVTPPGLSWNYCNFTVKCSEPPQTAFLCTEEHPCLFDVENDPCEHTNLYDTMPEKVAELQAALKEYRKTTVLPWLNFAKSDSRANPALFNDSLAPWMPADEDRLYYPTGYNGPGYDQFFLFHKG